jgi:hypothetical protein
MLFFMWHGVVIGVARTIDACLESLSTGWAPVGVWGGQASEQPYVGWKICNHFFFFLLYMPPLNIMQ